jgi:hypothetical protein
MLYEKGVPSMHQWKRLFVFVSAVVILGLAVLAFLPEQANAIYPNQDTVAVYLTATVALAERSWEPADLWCSGTLIQGRSDPYVLPGGDWVNCDITDMEFSSILESGIGRVFIFGDACQSGGCPMEWEPSPDFPAESFFDVYFHIEFPDLIPGEILHNEIPLRISSFVAQWPPYFEVYESDPAVPIPLHNEAGLIVGELQFWRQEHMPYYPPNAHINVPTDKYSNVLVPIEEFSPFVEVNANLITNVPCEINSATFRWRPADTPDPFIDFGVDLDGSAPKYSTIKEMGTGDGWSALFDLNLLPPDGIDIEFEVEFNVGWPYFSIWRDTILGYGDPIPPFPYFWEWPEDSIGYFRPDSIHAIPVLFYDDWVTFWETRVLPLAPAHHRTLTPIDQLGLGTAIDSVSCGPTAAASCLKYWADNGYPEIEHPDGDTSKPKMTPEQIARELQGTMGTDSTGSTAGGMMDGIEDYLDNHGLDGWEVEGWAVEDAEDLAEMFEEFEADSEDVIILMQDTTAAGDTIGHAVTMGSKTSSFYEVITDEIMCGCIRHNVDFMDPWGGGSTADNEYPVDYDANGQPTTSGYSLGGAGDAWIFGYIKVSPPEGGGGGSLQAIKLSDKWITVDDGSPTVPPGMPDTLYWDTAGFEGGVYLLEVRTETASGIITRALRLCGIPEYNTDTGEMETPGAKTMLQSSYPNPFNPTTTIEYSLARKGKVTIAVYDIAGRLVKRLLVDELVEAGDHRVVWDGKNENGVKVASGVYFCSMKTAEEVSGIKMILLR